MSQLYTITAPAQPALTPPPNVIPDFEDPFSLRPYHTLVGALCVVGTTVAMAARIYTKWRLVRSVRWEDCKPDMWQLKEPLPDPTFLVFCVVGWVQIFVADFQNVDLPCWLTTWLARLDLWCSSVYITRSQRTEEGITNGMLRIRISSITFV